MRNFLHNPGHWRERAEKTRAMADRLWSKEEQKQRLLRIAMEYDLLADHAAECCRSEELLRNVKA